MALPDNVPLDKNSQPYPLVYLQALVDDAIKGILRSIGDAGDSPANTTGETFLKIAKGIQSETQRTREVLGYGFVAATLTTTALAASATYTGASKDFLNVVLGFVSVLAFADQAGEAYIEQSIDGDNWDLSESVAVSASTGTKLKKEVVARFVRAKYINGGVQQGVFRFGWRHALA